MAQAQMNISQSDVSNKNSKIRKTEESDVANDQNAAVFCIPECAVCLQICIHPARLPCNHIFCYLCIKGVANQSKRCPMCRQEIPTDFLEKPELLEMNYSHDKQTASTDDSSLEEYQWFYEGRNGWWKYDTRTNQVLEAVYDMGYNEYEILICGTLYVIDFQQSCQYKKNQPTCKRVIKRDLANAPCKGVAGIR